MTDNPHQAPIAFHVLIAAAGSSRRVGGPRPKQYTMIGNKTLLRHTLDNVLSWPGIVSCSVIIDPQHTKSYQKSTEGLNLRDYTEGGKTRKLSISSGLNNLSDLKHEEIVLIHDAARPFTKWNDVERLLKSITNGERAATLARRVSDSLSRKDVNIPYENIKRDDLWALQTPQAFRFGDIKAAHEKSAKDSDHTDDTSVLMQMGIETALVEGSTSNFKITTADDLDMAKRLLESPDHETRSGIGFDVHAFAPNKERPFVLCGIEIKDSRSLAGHSDADVALHALTDALLGAIGENDIGHHFPPSNDAFKDMDSRIFLNKSVEMLRNKGGKIINADITIICETPKIEPHRENMKHTVAALLNVSENRINIKATTTEKLGFTGREEGIAAQALVNVLLPA